MKGRENEPAVPELGGSEFCIANATLFLVVVLFGRIRENAASARLGWLHLFLLTALARRVSTSPFKGTTGTFVWLAPRLTTPPRAKSAAAKSFLTDVEWLFNPLSSRSIVPRYRRVDTHSSSLTLRTDSVSRFRSGL